MLTTNMIRKDLNSQNQYDAGTALSGLSCFISVDLARDICNDIMTLVSVDYWFISYIFVTSFKPAGVNKALFEKKGCSFALQSISKVS